MQTAQASEFIPAHRAAIESVCLQLSGQYGLTFIAEYGQTECGQFHDAALCVDEDGACGSPLVSLITGPGIAGDGFAVMGADGSSLADRATFTKALRVAQTVARRMAS